MLILLLVVPGCGDVAHDPDDPSVVASKGRGRPSHAVKARSPAVKENKLRVVFLGTSLTAGLGVAQEEAYPARLVELLETRGLPIEAINAGVSGDTSAGGLSRLGWLLRIPPDIIVIELGVNDGLRGLPVEMTEANLIDAVSRAKGAGARVILAGMLMPPNYGEDYTRRFAAVFPRVASQTGSILVPFLLDGVAADPKLNQADGMHPNAEGHEQIARTLLPFLLDVIGRLGSGERLAEPRSQR